MFIVPHVAGMIKTKTTRMLVATVKTFIGKVSISNLERGRGLLDLGFCDVS
jgi:hypothetical protein